MKEITPKKSNSKGAAGCTVCAVGISLICIILVSIFVVSLLIYSPQYTQRTHVLEYGDWSGSGSTEFVTAYIESFFPDTIDSAFSDVVFSYRANNADTYAFEAYLEFRVEDPVVFRQYISSIAVGDQWKEFSFDSSFQELAIEDHFVIGHDYPLSDRIIQAKVRKVLFDAQTQTIIYYAMGVFDGGVADIEHFHQLFQRFAIDPKEYAQNCASGTALGPFEI